jgi:hypothetical protein
MSIQFIQPSRKRAAPPSYVVEDFQLPTVDPLTGYTPAKKKFVDEYSKIWQGKLDIPADILGKQKSAVNIDVGTDGGDAPSGDLIDLGDDFPPPADMPGPPPAFADMPGPPPAFADIPGPPPDFADNPEVPIDEEQEWEFARWPQIEPPEPPRRLVRRDREGRIIAITYFPQGGGVPLDTYDVAGDLIPPPSPDDIIVRPPREIDRVPLGPLNEEDEDPDATVEYLPPVYPPPDPPEEIDITPAPVDVGDGGRWRLVFSPEQELRDALARRRWSLDPPEMGALDSDSEDVSEEEEEYWTSDDDEDV